MKNVPYFYIVYYVYKSLPYFNSSITFKEPQFLYIRGSLVKNLKLSDENAISIRLCSVSVHYYNILFLTKNSLYLSSSQCRSFILISYSLSIFAIKSLAVTNS